MKVFYFVMALLAVFSLYTNVFWEHGLLKSTAEMGGVNAFLNLLSEEQNFRSAMFHLLYSMVAGGYFLFRFVKSEWK